MSFERQKTFVPVGVDGKGSMEEDATNPESVEEYILNSSAAAMLLLQIAKENKEGFADPNLLIFDLDGTIIASDLHKVIHGSYPETVTTEETMANIHKERKAKWIPLIMNTARIESGDTFKSMPADRMIPTPDVAIGGMGLGIFWTQRDGTLVYDKEYDAFMREQKITYKENGVEKTETYNNKTVHAQLHKTLQEYMDPYFVGMSNASSGEDTTEGIGGGMIRYEVKGMPYESAEKLAKAIEEKISGVRVSFCEKDGFFAHGGGNKSEWFSGYVYVFPKTGGKDEAAKYVIRKLSDALQIFTKNKNHKIIANIVGDGPNDIEMLTMEARPNDPFTINRFLVNNALPYTQKKINERIQTLDPEGEKKMKLSVVGTADYGILQILQGIGEQKS